MSSFGVLLASRWFVVSPEEAARLGLGTTEGSERVIRPTLNGRDLTTPPRDRYVIDLYGLTSNEARERFPEVYEHIVREVKPLRDENRRKSYRENWWLHAEARRSLREALGGLERYIATPETAKHRLFQFLPAEALPEHGVITFGLDDAFHLGVLSSRIHETWALAAGGRLGIGNDPRYNSSRTFSTFPFPLTTDAQAERVRSLGEAIDAHRKARQAAYPTLGLTNLYNAIEAIRAGRDLNAADQRSAEAGLAHTLADLHRDLDRAVLDAYGWNDLNADTSTFESLVLNRLVALNASQREEERQGMVRYLRPSFQNPGASEQAGLHLAPVVVPVKDAVETRLWPSTMASQTVAVRQAVAALGSADAAAVAARFSGATLRAVTPVLETLAELGLVRSEESVYVA